MKYIIFILLLSFLSFSNALKCYTCSVGENDVDFTCVTDPVNTGGSAITDCDKKYCTTVRQELLDPKGELRSFIRSCTDKPDYMDDVIEDSTYRYYYKACKTDLCNGGSGKGDNDGSTSGALGDKSMILAPGMGSNAVIITLQISLLIVTLIINLLV